jgi:hypothetical protein
MRNIRRLCRIREQTSMISGFARGVRTARLAAGLAIGLCVGLTQAGWAGGSGLDEIDDADAGTPFFGFVKDVTVGGTMPDTKVVAEIKGGNASLVTRTDVQGHYRIAGFGKDVNPDTIEIRCSRDGYKLQRAVRRKLSNDPGAPVEVDCLMAKQ